MDPAFTPVLGAAAFVFLLGLVVVLTLDTATAPTHIVEDDTSLYRMESLQNWMRTYFGLWWPYSFLFIAFLFAIIWYLAHFWFSTADVAINIDAGQAFRLEIIFAALSFVVAVATSVFAVHLFLQNSTNPFRLNQNGGAYVGPTVRTNRNSLILLLVGGGAAILFALPIVFYVFWGYFRGQQDGANT